MAHPRGAWCCAPIVGLDSSKGPRFKSFNLYEQFSIFHVLYVYKRHFMPPILNRNAVISIVDNVPTDNRVSSRPAMLNPPRRLKSAKTPVCTIPCCMKILKASNTSPIPPHSSTASWVGSTPTGSLRNEASVIFASCSAVIHPCSTTYW